MTTKHSSPLKVLLNSGIYSVTSIIQKALGFILLPLYTIYLTPEDYGITGIVNSIINVLSLLFTLSLNGAVQRYYYVYIDDKEKIKSFNGTILLFIMMNSIFWGTLIIIFRDILISPFIDNIAFYPYIFMGVLTVIITPVYTIYQSLLQTMEKSKEYAITTLSYFVISVVLNIAFIVVLKWGATGQLLSVLITGMLFLFISIYSLFKKDVVNLKFDFKFLKEGLIYSIPLVPHLMSTNLANLISRVFLNNQISTSSAGIFNISSQFTLIIDTFQMSVNSAYIPWFYGLMNEGEEGHPPVIRFADLMSSIYLIIGLAFSLFIKELIQLFLSDSYLISWVLIPTMMIGYQVRTIYLFYVNTLFYNTKATRFIFIASLSGSLVNIIITALFTKSVGLMAPAIAFLIQQIFTAVIVVLLSRKKQPVFFKIHKMILYIVILSVASSIGLYYDYKNPLGEISLINIIYKFIILLIVLVYILYINRKAISILYRNKFS